MIFFYEFKKLVRSPIVLGLTAVCLLLNVAFLLVEYDNRTPQDQTHTDINLRSVNVFETYKASGTADFYIQALQIAGARAENIRDKYDWLQLTLDKKSAHTGTLAAYFDRPTSDFQVLLFGKLFKHMVSEIALLAMLVALLSTTYEQMRGTEPILYASKTGRHIQVAKLCASLTLSLLLSLLVIGASLAVLFNLFNFSVNWHADVSRVFDHALGETKPFMTWHSFTVAGYLRATIGISIGLALSGCLLGYAAGIGFRGVYPAFVAVIVVIAILFVIPQTSFLPYGSVARSLWALNPVSLWRNSGTWFTDGRVDVLWAHFESMGLSASLILLAVAAHLAYQSLKRRELN